MSVRRLADAKVQPASFAFNRAMSAEVKKWQKKYPKGREQSAVIPLLMLAQEQEGWVSQAAIEHVAGMLDMPKIRVLEVATFYTQFQLAPVGTRAHVQVCGTTPCMLRGSEELIKVCKSKIHAEPFHLNDKGTLSWEEVECLGACVNAPMVMIFKDAYEDLTPERLGEIIDQFEAGKGASVPVGPQNGRWLSAPLTGLTALKDEKAVLKSTRDKAAKAAQKQAVAPKSEDAVKAEAAKPAAEAAKPAPKAEAAKPEPKAAAKPAPKVEAPKPAPKAETAKPSPKLAAPAVKAEAPKAEPAKRVMSVIEAAALAEARAVPVRPAQQLNPPRPGARLKPSSLPSAASLMAAPAAKPAAEQKPDLMAKPRGGKGDDLSLIWGVGPKLEKMLNTMGVWHFDQIAAWGKAELNWVDARLEGFKGRASRDEWVKQAKKLAKGWRPDNSVGDKPV